LEVQSDQVIQAKQAINTQSTTTTECACKCSVSLVLQESAAQQHTLPTNTTDCACTCSIWYPTCRALHPLFQLDLANLCVKRCQLFRSPPSSPKKLRDFVSPVDTKGLALYMKRKRKEKTTLTRYPLFA